MYKEIMLKTWSTHAVLLFCIQHKSSNAISSISFSILVNDFAENLLVVLNNSINYAFLKLVQNKMLIIKLYSLTLREENMITKS